MNCRPGDLAVIAHSFGDPTTEKYLGRVVRCISLLEFTGAHWLIDPEVDGFDLCADRCLKPIRDKPGDDETLTWAGKPQPIKVTSDEEAERITSTIPNAHVQVVRNGRVVSEYWSVV